MEFKIIYRKDKSVGFLFESEIPKKVSEYLKELGFRDYLYAPLKLLAKDRPSYHRFINDFQEALQNDLPWSNIIIHPSYEPSDKHITENMFSKIQFSVICLSDGS